MTDTKKVSVFFSWQSDSLKKTNANAIRSALVEAKRSIEDKAPKIEIVLEEATRNVPGSPDIVATLLKKIRAADIFVADITTVVTTEKGRACPNPNVTFELGFAAAELGWDRIILVFNAALGNLNTDLPFDIRQQRTLEYTYADKPDAKTAGKDLFDGLCGAVTSIIDTDPLRPAALRGLTRHEIEHDHDVRHLRRMMHQLHLPTIQEMMERLPKSFPDAAIAFFEDFKGVVSNLQFSLYDRDLLAEIIEFYKGWNNALSFGVEYINPNDGPLWIFHTPGDVFSQGSAKSWKKIERARNKMAKALAKILARIREGYVEINIEETSAAAWAAYVKYQKEHGLLPEAAQTHGGEAGRA